MRDCEDELKKRGNVVDQLEEEKSAHQNKLMDEGQKKSEIERTIQ